MTYRVMLIDDSETDLLYTQIVLESAGPGYEVLKYESAREALAFLKQPGNSVDLILLDINMPGMNGYEFLEAYDHLPSERRAQGVVVMLSSSPLPDDRERSMSYPPVRGYVTKPVELDAADGLLRYIRR
jgi:CheY-like chemotaxis protein